MKNTAAQRAAVFFSVFYFSGVGILQRTALALLMQQPDIPHEDFCGLRPRSLTVWRKEAVVMTAQESLFHTPADSVQGVIADCAGIAEIER